MTNQKEYNFAKRIVAILGKKALKGCKDKKWKGFQNGNGEEFGTELDELIKDAKQFLKSNK